MYTKPLSILIFFYFVLLTPCAHAVSDEAMPQATVGQQAVPSNPITQAAVQSGVLACTSRINQVATFLTSNTQSGAFLFTSPSAPDKHIFSASIELIPANTPSLYASTSFTPTPAGGCDAVYDTVQYVPEECRDVANIHFKTTEPPGALKKDISMLKAGTVRFFLMPAGKNGCVIIKKEVVE